ncbi:hypothetical protein HPP92_008412 [Vanilla planifolia]|uniref:Uncharacterized protein n=1 Tax=Vanilla planifolia TaxID=51239 RepID=A0A835RHN5_VANPL|nr:hypothetical protein HPP92_008412 [Vanilla planifolia]
MISGTHCSTENDPWVPVPFWWKHGTISCKAVSPGPHRRWGLRYEYSTTCPSHGVSSDDSPRLGPCRRHVDCLLSAICWYPMIGPGVSPSEPLTRAYVSFLASLSFLLNQIWGHSDLRMSKAAVDGVRGKDSLAGRESEYQEARCSLCGKKAAEGPSQ